MIRDSNTKIPLRCEEVYLKKDLKVVNVIFYFYKSKTELRFARIKSLSRIQKAIVRYTPNPNPAVTNDI